MTKTRMLFVALAVTLVAANVRASWQDALQKAEDKVQADRAKKAAGLSSEKLKKAWPTPEMLFDTVPLIAPGESATVLAQGTFQPETTFIVTSDDVDVQGAQLTPKGWKATLKAKADALPGDVNVLAIAPVSGIQRSEIAARIGAKYAIDATLENGWSVKITPDDKPLDGAQYPAQAQWFKGGSKAPFRTGPVYVRADGGSLDVEIPPNQDELAAAGADGEALVQAANDAYPPGKVEELTKKMEACQKVPPERMEACLTPYMKEMQALSAAAEQKLKKQRDGSQSAQNSRAFGCLTVRLSRSEGRLSGTAEGCEGRESMDVTSAKIARVK